MIYLSSDWHIKKGDKKCFSLLNLLKKEDMLIITGDFCDEWTLENEKFWFLKELEKFPCTILFLDGNHDSLNILNQLPRITFHNAKVHCLGRNLYHVMRGEILSIEGKKIFLMGGGYSGESYRRNHPNVWDESEIPNYKERENAFYHLKKENWKVDYVLTHTAPYSIMKECSLEGDIHEYNHYLDAIKEMLSFQTWYFGHFHENRNLQEKYRIIYQSLRKLEV